MRVILLGSGERPGVWEAVEQLRPEIVRCCDIVAEDFTATQNLNALDADFAIVFGGDGSILRAAVQMGNRQFPVVSVNLGTLGFLADFTPKMLSDLLTNGKTIHDLPCEEYLMLSCQVWRRKQLLLEHTALNEAAVQAGPPYRMLEIDLFADQERITTYHCDGLIISTPVGSTARNLSAGGPILRNTLDVVTISPVSAHTLSHRPVVDSASRVYRLQVRTPEASILLDGRTVMVAEAGDHILVTRAASRFKMIKPPDFSYYQTLREKLGWGGLFDVVEKKSTVTIQSP
ncbi:MAG: NAD(+)/NADH kinase [Planctomycetaceae bacterium]|jgi:NAD+ kinase|nr:NAD(+)/NADH kinase [Planctomycetaceae bacterium]